MADIGDDEDEADVDEILRQIREQKLKELRLRAERERVRAEIKNLRGDALWTREQEQQSKLDDVRKARAQLSEEERRETERLSTLSGTLREREMSMRKAWKSTTNPLQLAATVMMARPNDKDASAEVLERPPVPAANQRVDAIRPSSRAAVADVTVIESARLSDLVPPRTFPVSDIVERALGSTSIQEQEQRVDRLRAQLEAADKLRQELTKSLSAERLQQHASTASSLFDLVATGARRQSSANESINPRPSSRSNPDQTSNNSAQPDQQGTQMVHQQFPVSASASPPFQPTFGGAPYATAHVAQPAWNGVPMNPYAAAYGAPVPSFAPAVFSYSSPWGAMPSMSMMPTMMPMMPPVISTVQYASAYGMPSSVYPFGMPWSPSPAYIPPTQPPPNDVSKPKHPEDDVSPEDLELQRLQETLQSIQTRLAAAPRADSQETEALRSIKQQHLEAITRLQQERDLIEEQEKLEDVRDRALRRRDEKKKELDQQQWMEDQKRELVALRMKRALARESAQSTDITRSGADVDQLYSSSNNEYNANNGLCLLWDFLSGLPMQCESVQLTSSVYDGKIPRTPFKVAASKEVEAQGPKHKRSLFWTSRIVAPLASTPELRLILEVSSTTANGSSMRSIGWTAMDLFTVQEGRDDLVLSTGFYKLPIKAPPMPDPSKKVITPPIDDGSTSMMLCLRVAHGHLADAAAQQAIDPDAYSGMHLPSTCGHRTKRHRQSIRLLSPSSWELQYHHPEQASLRRMLTRQLRGLRTRVGASCFDMCLPFTTVKLTFLTTILGPNNTTPLARPGNDRDGERQRDFLDIERLRMMTSASSRPTTTRPVSSFPVRANASKLFSLHEDSEDGLPWIKVDHSTERGERLLQHTNAFMAGDGFNVYVDAARSLPDNMSYSQVSVEALDADRVATIPIDSYRAFASAASDTFNPTFGLYAEFRGTTFNPTLTLVIRIDTIDGASKSAVTAGYALLPLFLDPESEEQPQRASLQQFMVNTGAFQLPLFRNLQANDAVDAASNGFSVRSTDGCQRIPCATVLVRVQNARRSPDGLTLLSRKDVPESAWDAQGLRDPAPPYHSGAYDSMACVPTPMEVKVYQLRVSKVSCWDTVHVTDKVQRKPTSATTSCDRLFGDTPDPITSAQEALKYHQNKPSGSLDPRGWCRYQPDIGFRVAVDALHNVKAKAAGTTGFFKVLFSVYPPGAFYQSIPLTSDVHFTTAMDWTSIQSSIEFKDGYLTLRDNAPSKLMVLVFDVRGIVRNTKTGKFSTLPVAWTFLPILTGNNTVATGNIQLPLFQGDVKLCVRALVCADQDIFKAAASLELLMEEVASDKKKAQLPLMDAASLFVRLEDPQVPSVPAMNPIVESTPSPMIPPKSVAKYSYDIVKITAQKKKTPLSKLLTGPQTEKLVEKELNEALAQVQADLLLHLRWLGSHSRLRRFAMLLKRKRNALRKALKTARTPPDDFEPLKPDDFDDVLYNVEMVHVKDDTPLTATVMEHAAELAVGVFFTLLLLLGCVLLGMLDEVLDPIYDVLRYGLPLLLVPLAWVFVLHMYEQYTAVPPTQHLPHQKIATF
ncbi:TPA: LOW QUALITY PROTEIN: hypothetical protein N0F65_001591 [Lagenidium giganteum]|uniref:Uncharacterized protein n=1 Tax=Lagenidium giganteum TaxID=4803 RepID=A0AAV2Z6Q2_9STRA|nr:TPA: LOW QUALITY PROTEIN: hypothetical protein N0F65_001591 [Lagenidium giganteum]